MVLTKINKNSLIILKFFLRFNLFHKFFMFIMKVIKTFTTKKFVFLTIVVFTKEYFVFDKEKNWKSAIIWSNLQFYGVIILVKTKSLCRGMALLPFQKSNNNYLIGVRIGKKATGLQQDRILLSTFKAQN